MFHKLEGVRIAALRVAVPSNEIRLEDEIGYYGSQKKINRLRAAMGMDKRRVCPPGVTASDLCAFAADNLLQSCPTVKNNIDALIFVTQSPDWKQPATACELQHRLGLPTACGAFDVNQGCSGYIYGLWLGATMVAACAARAVLVLVGDAMHASHDRRNRVIAPVFGDGGSATMLMRDKSAAPMYFEFGTDGSGFDKIITPGGGARIPFLCNAAANEPLVEDNIDASGVPWQLINIYMDGGAIFDFTMNVVPEHITAFMRHANVAHDDIDWLMLHQANCHIVRAVAEKCGFEPAKAPGSSFSLYGNLASASIPAALCHEFSGNSSPGTLLLCGFGIGLAWGSCLCKPDCWDCSPILDYVPDPHCCGREERIANWQKKWRGENGHPE